MNKFELYRTQSFLGYSKSYVYSIGYTPMIESGFVRRYCRCSYICLQLSLYSDSLSSVIPCHQWFPVISDHQFCTLCVYLSYLESPHVSVIMDVSNDYLYVTWIFGIDSCVSLVYMHTQKEWVTSSATEANNWTGSLYQRYLKSEH